MTHERLVVEKSSESLICGSAMFTMVASSTTISCVAAMTARVMPLFGPCPLRVGEFLLSVSEIAKLMPPAGYCFVCCGPWGPARPDGVPQAMKERYRSLLWTIASARL